MNLRPSLLASICAAAFGCAAESDFDDTSRHAPAEPLALTIEGYGAFEGRAEYEVSEPAGVYSPAPELVLSAARVDTGELVTLRLGQKAPGDIDQAYVFPARDHGFYLKVEGNEFEGQFGEVRLDESEGKLVGHFELSSTEKDGTSEIMLKGTFSADQLYLNCNRLADEAAGSNPGRATDGPDVTWTPDAHLESSFCAAMRDRLGALYGG